MGYDTCPLDRRPLWLKHNPEFQNVLSFGRRKMRQSNRTHKNNFLVCFVLQDCALRSLWGHCHARWIGIPIMRSCSKSIVPRPRWHVRNFLYSRGEDHENTYAGPMCAHWLDSKAIKNYCMYINATRHLTITDTKTQYQRYLLHVYSCTHAHEYVHMYHTTEIIVHFSRSKRRMEYITRSR